jgi:hypothetical protein
MGETNPLFETSGELVPDAPTYDVLERVQYRTRYKAYQPPVVEPELQVALAAALTPITITSSLTLTSGERALVDEQAMSLDMPAIITKSMEGVRQILFAAQERLQAAPATNPARYRPRQVRPSDATAFSNIETPPVTEPGVHHLARYLWIFFRRPYGRALADRIESLAEMIREDSNGSDRLSGWSVGHLIAFLESNPSVVRPKLAAGPLGELIAMWNAEGKGEFSARFMPNGSIRFVVTTPSEKHPEGVSRTSGDTTIDELYKKAGLAHLDWVISG